MVEYYKTALRTVKNPRTFKSVSLNVISVVVLPSLSGVAFNYVIMYFNYSYTYF